ncbi:cell division transport system ATP-binding protein [Lachnospiraceae bacterium YSD2013]|jgi:cell division transport system ATP-binding protein|nr:cell division transport system ATP-binding protein [Lachnospiraceae bacterium YSD2013]
MALPNRKKKLMEDDEVIVMENVSKSYQAGIPALSNVSLKIKKGEFVFVVGDSGSGKSTFIKLLLREIVPTEGNLYVLNYNLNKIKHRKIPKFRRNLGVVFQDFRLLKDRNVYENVAFAQRIIQVPGKQIRKNVPKVLATVGLAGKYKAKPGKLSGGEQQRVAIARALVNRPTVLLADEPTGNLDPNNSMEIMRLLEEINNAGTTVIMVTHNKDIVNAMQKRVITLRKGVIVSDHERGGYDDED